MKRMMRLALLGFAVLGCTKPVAPLADVGDTGDGRRPAASASTRAALSNAPPIDACETHDDCTVMVWDGPFGADPCCDTRSGYMPIARSYLQFMTAYRTAHCGGVKCPAAAFPGAEPACCAGSARCVAHKCISGCEDATARYPNVSVISPMCKMGLVPPSPSP
jgi:hypothetical protein